MNGNLERSKHGLHRGLGAMIVCGLILAAAPACGTMNGTGKRSKSSSKVPAAKAKVVLPTTQGKAQAVKAGSVYQSVLHGLRLIHAGNFDGWISGYCHSDQCTTLNARRALKRYNLPALKRRSPHCLRGPSKMTLEVTRTDKLPAGAIKIFVKCHPKGSPYPFTLKKDGAKWKWVTS